MRGNGYRFFLVTDVIQSSVVLVEVKLSIILLDEEDRGSKG
jgi:hypothetical protein